LALNKTDESYFETNDGSATVIVNDGVEPYNYNWSNGGDVASIINLTPGNYSVEVTDAVGCITNEMTTIQAIDCSNFRINVNKVDESYFQANNGFTSRKMVQQRQMLQMELRLILIIGQTEVVELQ